MKRVAGLILALLASAAFAQVQVNGYTKKDGAYVAPHMRSSPNNTQNDNYSTKGNVNPYTAKEGTVDPQQSYNTYAPPAPQPVQHVAPNRQSGYEQQKRSTGY